jgi:hypothetical protein
VWAQSELHEGNEMKQLLNEASERSKQESWKELFATGIIYDFTTRIAYVCMGNGLSADINKCIERFRSIDPEVQMIHTFSDDGPNISYHLEGGDWVEFDRGHNKVVCN